MEQIVIRVQSKAKARMLFELLSSLEFVEFIETSQQDNSQQKDATEDFFALAGLWEGRDVDLDTLRQSAWPRQMP